MTEVTAVVLAAGQGKRMKSDLPKVLHPIAGRPLIYYPIQAAVAVGVRRIVVVTSATANDATRLQCRSLFAHLDLEFVVQDPPQGTGHAASIGATPVTTERALILYGDTPLLRPRELAQLVSEMDRGSELALLSCQVAEPKGYGRVLRDARGGIVEVREDRDLRTAEEHAVREVNAGVYAAETKLLRAALARLSPDNAQGEYYLTDIVSDLARAHKVTAVVGDESGLLGVNDRAQLREAETVLYARRVTELGQSGVTIRGNVLVDTSATVEPGATLEDGVRLRGETKVGSDAMIDVGCVVTDCTIDKGALLKPYTVMTQSSVGEGAQIGPFAHLRPECTIEAEARIGNFVETKKTIMRRGAKANHLSYIGDGDIGERANIGAGTIFCNYDGFKKHRTRVGAEVFIGSDSQLIAPVELGRGAYVGTGTTVTDDVPEDGFAIGRCRQTTKPGYAKLLKERLSDGKR